MADKKKQDQKNKKKAEEESEKVKFSLDAWQNLTGNAAGIPKSYGIAGQPISLNAALGTPACSKDLFAVNSETNLTRRSPDVFNLSNLLSNLNKAAGFQFDPSYPSSADATLWNRFSITDPLAAATLYRIDQPQGITGPNLTSSSNILGWDNLQNSPLFGAVGGSIANGNIVFGRKSVEELEKEERAAELKKIEEKSLERDKKRDEELLRVNQKLEILLKEREKVMSEREEDRKTVEAAKALLEERWQPLQGIKTKYGDRKGNIFFDRNKGEIKIAKSKKGGELEPKTPVYFFFMVLFESFPNAIDYETLAKSVLALLGKKTQARTMEDYCWTLKSALKKKSSVIADLIEDFTNAEGKKGYRLRSKPQ